MSAPRLLAFWLVLPEQPLTTSNYKQSDELNNQDQRPVK